jgi:hypothetical protein
MSGLTLVLNSSNFKTTAQALCANSNLLMDHPDLQSYTVQSSVSPETFQAFLRALEEGSDLALTPDDFAELSSLCDEFGVGRLKRACEQFVQSVSVGSSLDFRFANSEFEFGEKLTI